MLPLAGYLIGISKVNDYDEAFKRRVQGYRDEIPPFLEEGCIGQLTEIYDGMHQNKSRGYFAQA